MSECLREHFFSRIISALMIPLKKMLSNAAPLHCIDDKDGNDNVGEGSVHDVDDDEFDDFEHKLVSRLKTMMMVIF